MAIPIKACVFIAIYIKKLKSIQWALSFFNGKTFFSGSVSFLFFVFFLFFFFFFIFFMSCSFLPRGVGGRVLIGSRRIVCLLIPYFPTPTPSAIPCDTPPELFPHWSKCAGYEKCFPAGLQPAPAKKVRPVHWVGEDDPSFVFYPGRGG